MDSTLLAVIITGVVTTIGVYLTNRVTKGGTKVTSQADVIAALQIQVNLLSARVDQMLEHDRIKENYIDVLRDHINQGKTPPPPPWPSFPKGI